jgi:hypothetical protein
MHRTRLADAVIVKAVATAEHNGLRLDDGDAVQTAARATPQFERRVALRAWLLAQRTGLADELARWRALMPWLLGGAALTVGLLSVPLLKSMIGEGRHISLLGALVAVLALPTASLLLWCASLLLGHGHAGGGIARAAGALATRLPGLRSRHSARLWAAMVDTLREAGLGLWALGALNHLFWIIAFAGVLLGLLGSFAFWSYTIGWETTILSPAFYQRVVAAIGWLPARLGVPQVQTGTGADAASLAWWLIGCTLVYGLLPRVLALALCLAVGWRRWARIGQLDLAEPALQVLAGRFDALDGAAGAVPVPAAPRTRAGLALVGLELPPGTEWPPLGPLPPNSWERCIAGHAAERSALLSHAAHTEPRAVLWVCRAAATPDRGTERLLLALAGHSERAAVWLLGESQSGEGLPGEGLPGHAEHPAWRPWLAASALARLAVLRNAGEAEAWLAEVQHG